MLTQCPVSHRIFTICFEKEQRIQKTNKKLQTISKINFSHARLAEQARIRLW